MISAEALAFDIDGFMDSRKFPVLVDFDSSFTVFRDNDTE